MRNLTECLFVADTNWLNYQLTYRGGRSVFWYFGITESEIWEVRKHNWLIYVCKNADLISACSLGVREKGGRPAFRRVRLGPPPEAHGQDRGLPLLLLLPRTERQGNARAAVWRFVSTRDTTTSTFVTRTCTHCYWYIWFSFSQTKLFICCLFIVVYCCCLLLFIWLS